MDNAQETIKYFRQNIYNARSSYEAWKMIYYARSKNVVGDEMSKLYTDIQNYHASFFTVAGNAFLTNFIILICHVFEKRSDSMSLIRIDKEKYSQFYKNNQEVIDEIKNTRNKIFAHKGKNINDLKIPSPERMKLFFNNIQDFYNELSSKKDNSTTWFDYDNLKHEIESLYKNLHRGENARLETINVEYFWNNNENIISKKS